MPLPLSPLSRWSLVALALALVACGENADPGADVPETPDAVADTTDAEDVADRDADDADAEDSAEDGSDTPLDADTADSPDTVSDADTAPDDTADVPDDPDGEVIDPPPVPRVPEIPDNPGPYPAPDARPTNHGPGLGRVSYTEEEIGENCAPLSGGELDHTQHHNLVVMYDGLVTMPWAPEFGRGGLTFFDFTDPCDPQSVGVGTSEHMRESHSIGFSPILGRWAVTAMHETLFSGGIMFWDVSDPTNPTPASRLPLPGYRYPDAYARVVLSTFWQAPYVYVAGCDNGVYIVDATDPLQPVLVTQYQFDPVLRAGQIHAVGNLLIVTAAEGTRTALLDISDPGNPQPIPGGEFVGTEGPDGRPLEPYFSNISGGYIYYARKSGGGGLYAYDIRDPEQPVWSGGYVSDGNGGYVFVQDNYAFVGESRFATIYDITDHQNITEVRRFHLEGDLDTFTPLGNVAVLSVDEGARMGIGSQVVPWATDPDTIAPYVNWAWPPDGSTNQALTTRVGVTFNEMVDVRSAFDGSVRLYRSDRAPDDGRVFGWASVQENVLNFWPARPLRPGTTYTFEIPAGGLLDYTGNTIEIPFQLSFTTEGTAPTEE